MENIELALVLSLIAVALLGATGLAHGAKPTAQQVAVHQISEQCKQGQPSTYSACMIRLTSHQRIRWAPVPIPSITKCY